MAEAYIYDAVRTPRGRGKPDGALHEVSTLGLANTALTAIRERNNLTGPEVDDVILGCVDPVGEAGGDIARAGAVVLASSAVAQVIATGGAGGSTTAGVAGRGGNVSGASALAIGLGTTGTATATVTATGGKLPYTWSITAGTVSPGMTLSAAGVFSGTPTTAGDFKFTVTVTT